MELDGYTLVMLRRGPRAFDYSEEELESLQAQHLAHLAEMRRRGLLLAGGPFVDQPDETFRGMSLYRTDPDETRRLAEADPSVRAGRLAVEVMTWLTPKGELAFPRAEREDRERGR